MPSAFISHSTPDDGYVAELESLLRASGFTEVFNDVHSIQPDEQFWPTIQKGIRDCDAFYIVLTSASMRSDWVDRESDYARSLDKKIIPIWVEDCDVPDTFAGRDVIDFRPRTRKDRKIAPSRILRHSPDVLFGREDELDALDRAWASRDTLHVHSLVAWGGAGKTALVAHWVAKRLTARAWPGVERYFDWSFYSQGAKEASQASADIFIARALEFFGDPDPQRGSPWDRGQRLALLVRQHRTLLVLDGIEPLQHPPNSPQAGELKDEALTALLQALAMDNPGLCVVTTREPLKNLESFHGGSVEEKKLLKLTKEAAISLLRHLRIDGSDAEMEAAWRDAGGHALTLQLLGRFLADAHDGDLRKRREVHFEEADRETPGRTAMKVMLAYEKWLEGAGPDRQRDLAVLRLTGLFDRPASPDCLAALRAKPAIPGLTDQIVGLQDWKWRKALKDLEGLDLITLSHAEGESFAETRNLNSDTSLDAHPLVREYFAKQLRDTQPEAFRAAHSRLFDHLCESTEPRPGTLPGLQPLYQAVTHGCLAGRQQEACERVYWDRIQRGSEFYSTRRLGALGWDLDLEAITAFFEIPWSRLSPNLTAANQAWLLNQAAFHLRALRRLTEAVEPMRVSGEMDVKVQQWKGAAISYSNLSELEVTMGRLEDASADGRRAIDFADRSGEGFLRMVNRITTADALFQRGEEAEARTLFEEAERMQAEGQPEYPLLYSLQGFRYCDLLLAPAERAAWQTVLGTARASRAVSGALAGNTPDNPGAPGSSMRSDQPARARVGAREGACAPPLVAACRAVTERATQTLKWIQAYSGHSLLDIGLDHLTLARASLYEAVLSNSWRAELHDAQTSSSVLKLRTRGSRPFTAADTPSPLSTETLNLETESALNGLRKAGQIDHVPKALLTAALHQRVIAGDPAAARACLDEAEQIARRDPMPLYQADVHLHRARLFHDPDELQKARALIDKHHYGRRLAELQDAEAAAESW